MPVAAQSNNFTQTCLRRVQVGTIHLLNGKREPDPKSVVGGLFETSDGWVRIHDSFPHHRSGACKLLGLPEQATKAEFEGAIEKWKGIDLEIAAIKRGLVIAALRSFEE